MQPEQCVSPLKMPSIQMPQCQSYLLAGIHVAVVPRQLTIGYRMGHKHSWQIRKIHELQGWSILKSVCLIEIILCSATSQPSVISPKYIQVCSVAPSVFSPVIHSLWERYHYCYQTTSSPIVSQGPIKIVMPILLTFVQVLFLLQYDRFLLVVSVN